MKKAKIGKIDISALNALPEKHEYETARYFANRGNNIVFIKPSNIKGSNSPDFVMYGKVWETKSPTGQSKRTYEDDLRKAAKQSGHVIFDLRRLKSSTENICIETLRHQSQSIKIKTLLAITRDGRILTIKGKSDIM